jgi:Papain-like cysteine protease AvrRpt2
MDPLAFPIFTLIFKLVVTQFDGLMSSVNGEFVRSISLIALAIETVYITHYGFLIAFELRTENSDEANLTELLYHVVVVIVVLGLLNAPAGVTPLDAFMALRRLLMLGLIGEASGSLAPIGEQVHTALGDLDSAFSVGSTLDTVLRAANSTSVMLDTPQLKSTAVTLALVSDISPQISAGILLLLNELMVRLGIALFPLVFYGILYDVSRGFFYTWLEVMFSASIQLSVSLVLIKAAVIVTTAFVTIFTGLSGAGLLAGSASVGGAVISELQASVIQAGFGLTLSALLFWVPTNMASFAGKIINDSVLKQSLGTPVTARGVHYVRRTHQAPRAKTMAIPDLSSRSLSRDDVSLSPSNRRLLNASDSSQMTIQTTQGVRSNNAAVPVLITIPHLQTAGSDGAVSSNDSPIRNMNNQSVASYGNGSVSSGGSSIGSLSVSNSSISTMTQNRERSVPAAVRVISKMDSKLPAVVKNSIQMPLARTRIFNRADSDVPVLRLRGGGSDDESQNSSTDSVGSLTNARGIYNIQNDIPVILQNDIRRFGLDYFLDEFGNRTLPVQKLEKSNDGLCWATTMAMTGYINTSLSPPSYINIRDEDYKKSMTKLVNIKKHKQYIKKYEKYMREIVSGKDYKKSMTKLVDIKKHKQYIKKYEKYMRETVSDKDYKKSINKILINYKNYAGTRMSDLFNTQGFINLQQYADSKYVYTLTPKILNKLLNKYDKGIIAGIYNGMIYGNTRTSGHAVLLTGINRDKVIYNDPNHRERQEVTFNQLNKALMPSPHSLLVKKDTFTALSFITINPYTNGVNLKDAPNYKIFHHIINMQGKYIEYLKNAQTMNTKDFEVFKEVIHFKSFLAQVDEVVRPRYNKAVKQGFIVSPLSDLKGINRPSALLTDPKTSQINKKLIDSVIVNNNISTNVLLENLNNLNQIYLNELSDNDFKNAQNSINLYLNNQVNNNNNRSYINKIINMSNQERAEELIWLKNNYTSRYEKLNYKTVSLSDKVNFIIAYSLSFTSIYKNLQLKLEKASQQTTINQFKLSLVDPSDFYISVNKNSVTAEELQGNINLIHTNNLRKINVLNTVSDLLFEIEANNIRNTEYQPLYQTVSITRKRRRNKNSNDDRQPPAINCR